MAIVVSTQRLLSLMALFHQAFSEKVDAEPN